MQPISAIGKKFGLSRSTLLYYDRLKLVSPTYRTAAGYRLYSADDEARLRQICRYRETGLSLAAIKKLLDDDHPTRTRVSSALHQRLTELNHEIAALRRQQQVILKLLPQKGQDRLARAMTKEKWVALLRALGLSDAEMMQWHAAFERQSPLAHQDFLESLDIPASEIRQIRAHSVKLAAERAE
ncbi:MAG: MerR family transcriptional regulator [Verrucomicrobia bacterium]|nr:MerR family transcriptional regulator [Verrucomicrobiota bacterium]